MKTVPKHEQKETLVVDVITPEHGERGAPSKTFISSKRELLDDQDIPPLVLHREKGRCFICSKTEKELNEPLEAHHFGIEWSFEQADIDWDRVKMDHPNFHWQGFKTDNPERFVDDMFEQGMLLCKKHHTGKGTGIHNIPFSPWILQRYLKEGTEFAPGVKIDDASDFKGY